MSKNYRVQVGNVKVAAFWNEPQGQNTKGYYSCQVVRSRRDQDGQWIDEKVSLFPNELIALNACIDQLQRIITHPEAFEINRNQNGASAPAPTTQTPAPAPAAMDVGDDIPF
ncbi:MAG: hypothetical protein E7011_02185 [Alphaproteobacteria bacterium]|nr:hypothetical protein [Alphaproteobacteria bacterium]